MFYAETDALRSAELVLDGAEGRHAATVRRIRPGEPIQVGDGRGLVCECVVTEARPGTLRAAIRQRRVLPPELPSVTVIQALVKGERADLAVETMTEAGVNRIVPWAASRSVPVWRDDRGVSRWRVKVREAAKQAGRPWLPEVTGLVGTEEAARLVAGAAGAWMLAPDASQPFSAQPFSAQPVPAGGELIVIIGPEGGIAPAEASQLTASGAVPCRLGPSVLRASTAGAVAVGVLLSRTARWS